MSPEVSLCRFDIELAKKKKAVHIVGIDEAGRGPLAGPVTACAAFIPLHAYDKLDSIINDSKKLSPLKREKAFSFMLSCGVRFGFGWAAAAEIDRTDILSSALNSMLQACGRLFICLKSLPELNFIPERTLVLVDGNHKMRNAGHIWQQPLIGGDAKSAAVAAASIFAKVIRDRWMDLLSEKYPEYGFSKHKGYGTQEHIRAISACGPCPEHRMTFAPLKTMFPSLSFKTNAGDNKMRARQSRNKNHKKECVQPELF